MPTSLLLHFVILALITAIVHSAIPRKYNKQNLQETRSIDVRKKLNKQDDTNISEKKVQSREINKENIASHSKHDNSLKKTTNNIERLKNNIYTQKKVIMPKPDTLLAKAAKKAVQQTKKIQESTAKKRTSKSNRKVPSVKKKPVVNEFPLNDIIYKGKASSK